jgi:hypothetical protein
LFKNCEFDESLAFGHDQEFRFEARKDRIHIRIGVSLNS